MTRAVYVIGGPGTGKSTLVANVISSLGLEYGEPEQVHEKANVRNLVRLRGTPLLRDGERAGLYLGILRGITSGTDALDKACPPVAREWAAECELPPILISEGMRLCFNDFLLSLHERSELLLVHLRADPEELEERFTARGSSQSAQFIKNGITRARRVAEAMGAAGVLVRDFDTTPWTSSGGDGELVVDLLHTWLKPA